MNHQAGKSKTIGVIGLGLIGGSLGLSFQKVGYKVFGLTHKESTAIRAKERGLANIVSTDPESLKECSIIVIALPIDQILKPDPALVKSLPMDAIITDVASVKAPVIKIWKELHPNFVPSHPMAGNNQSGVEAGVENLFQSKPWVSTPDKTTNSNAIKIIKELAISIGCNWISADSLTHDKAVALISHLPVLVSAALLKSAGIEKNESILNLAIKLSSSGFEDTTRVGGGNPLLGMSMIKNNSSAILHCLRSYQESLKKIEQYIICEQWEALIKELETTKIIRKNFLDD